MTHGEERRTSPRIERCGDYFMLPATREEVPCVLKNISVTGACIFSSEPLQMNEVVVLHVCRAKDLSLKSQVVWEKCGEYGLSFRRHRVDLFKEALRRGRRLSFGRRCRLTASGEQQRHAGG